jgi:hypothetical protein
MTLARLTRLVFACVLAFAALSQLAEEATAAAPSYRAHRRPDDTILVDQFASAYADDVASFPVTANVKMPLADIEFVLTALWPNGVPNDANWLVERYGVPATYTYTVHRASNPVPQGTRTCGPYAKLQDVVNKKVLTQMAADKPCPAP